MSKNKLALIAHNIRSTHNVGSLMRTAEGLGLDHLYLTGYSPYPLVIDDERLPHLSRKLTVQIHKTALGAENSLAWSQHIDIFSLLTELKKRGYYIVALEQTATSKDLTSFKPSQKIALVVGNEVDGLDKQTLGIINEAMKFRCMGKKSHLT